LQWEPRPEGASGEALLAAGWFRFLAAPHTYWDHRPAASTDAKAESRAGGGASSDMAASGDSAPSSGGGDSASGSPRAAAAAAAAGVKVGSASGGGFDFSHQHDASDGLSLSAAPLWVRQRVAAMDRDPNAAKVKSAPCL